MEAKMEDKAELQRMPFLSHLSEMRLRIRNAVIAFLVAGGVCYPARVHIFKWLAKPLLSSFQQAEQHGLSGRFIFTGLLEPFMVLFKTALVAGLFLSCPFIFYQIWKFLAPGLYPREKKWTIPFVGIAICLFVLGSLFCYRFVLPASYQFLLKAGYEAAGTLQQALGANIPSGDSILRPMLSMDEYFSLTLTMLVIFGAVFELPLILSLLSIVGVVSSRSLLKWNRYAILVFAIVGAILTPGDLVIGQLMMTAVLTVLYNASILFAWLLQRFRKRENVT